MRTIAHRHLTEDELVAAIADAIGAPARPLRVGIGDDAAVWQSNRHHLSLATTDMLVDGVHFRLGQTDAASLGHKSLAVNLSDIAAMGGSPLLAVVALGVTADFDEQWVRSFYRGMAALARRFRCAIAGGDIVRCSEATVAVTVIGEVRRTSLRLRSGAKPGDIVAVTGPLGLAAAGLRLIEQGRHDKGKPSALAAYVTPQPRLREGRFLGSRRAVHAMMDLSDGISTDVQRMARASNVDAVLTAGALYAHPEVLATARALQLDPADLMLNGGDDYELLVAVDRRAYRYVAQRFHARFGRPLASVGYFERGDGRAFIERDGVREPLAARGYDHLSYKKTTAS